MTSALEGGEGVVEKWTTVLISCVTRGGEGVQKSEIFTDIIDGSPLMNGFENGKQIHIFKS